MKNEKEIKRLKVQLLKAIVNKDEPRQKQLQDQIDTLDPRFIITDSDGKRHKMPPGWFERWLKKRPKKETSLTGQIKNISQEHAGALAILYKEGLKSAKAHINNNLSTPK